MTPSEQCKQAGLKSLKEVSEMTETSVQTLINWHTSKPRLFDVVVIGCAKMKAENIYLKKLFTIAK